MPDNQLRTGFQTCPPNRYPPLQTLVRIFLTRVFSCLCDMRLAAVSFSLCTISFAAAADDATSSYKISTKHPADRVAIAVEADATVISIRSPGGIGEATLERIGTKWPAKIVLRLHLNGLEDFRISTATTKLSVAVASSAQTPRVRIWKDDQEANPLGPNDRLWIRVGMLDEQRQPTDELPLKSGLFELALPPLLFEQQPKSITLRWIDFYR